MLRILFLTQFFPPEIGAPQTRILQTARALQDLGHDVSVLTGFPNYPSGVIPAPYRGRLWLREEISQIRVARAWLYATPNVGFLKRSLAHISFALSAFLLGPWLVPRPDVIVVDMHPLFLCVTALALGRIWKAPYVVAAGDLIPDQAVDVGVLRNPLAIRVIKSLARFILLRAGFVMALSQGIGQTLRRRGVPADRLRVVYYGANWLQSSEPADGTRVDLALPPAKNGQRLTVTYAGTHGLGHALDVVLDAAEILKEQPDVHFFMIGDGTDKERLTKRAAGMGLTNLTMLQPVPHSAMADVYARSDVCLISVRKSEFRREMGLPCKVFEIMAAGKAAIVADEGEAATLVSRAEAGIVVPPQSPEDLARAVLRMRDDCALREKLGRNGQAYVMQHLSRERQSREYEEILARASG